MIKRELPFAIIPGPSSILTALVGSGFSTRDFTSADFFRSKADNASGNCVQPPNVTKPRSFLNPHRLTKHSACIVIMSDRQLCVARELTKKFEEFRRGTARELLTHYEAHPPKGEIVLMISKGRQIVRFPRDARQMPRKLSTKSSIEKGLLDSRSPCT
jgi:16S rRNA (cytidine1402-2'-O)-methyltransferase